jgi:hypothetical protein
MRGSILAHGQPVCKPAEHRAMDDDFDRAVIPFAIDRFDQFC